MHGRHPNAHSCIKRSEPFLKTLTKRHWQTQVPDPLGFITRRAGSLLLRPGEFPKYQKMLKVQKKSKDAKNAGVYQLVNYYWAAVASSSEPLSPSFLRFSSSWGGISAVVFFSLDFNFEFKFKLNFKWFKFLIQLRRIIRWFSSAWIWFKRYDFCKKGEGVQKSGKVWSFIKTLSDPPPPCFVL